MRRRLRGGIQSVRGGELMRRKAFDSTLFKRAVCVEPTHPYVRLILHTGADKALVYCKYLGEEKVLPETIQNAQLCRS